MAQQLTVLAEQAWKPEFDPWNSQKGGRKELTPYSCPLTSIRTPWHACPYTFLMLTCAVIN